MADDVPYRARNLPSACVYILPVSYIRIIIGYEMTSVIENGQWQTVSSLFADVFVRQHLNLIAVTFCFLNARHHFKRQTTVSIY